MADFRISTAIGAVDKLSRPVRRAASVVSGRLGRAFRAADAAASGLASKTARLATGFRGLAVAGVSVGAAAKALDGYIAKGDELAKFSRQIGFTAEGLQEFQFAAERVGVGADLFDNSMGAFTKRLGEARAGQGALLAVLKKAGPAFKDQILNAGSTEEALELYIAAMRKIEDPAARAAFAAGAFSRAGMKMARFADVAADEISNLRDEKRRLGVITNEQAAATETAADRLASFKAAIFGVFAGIGAKVLPVFTRLVEGFTDWISISGEAGKSKLDIVFARIGDVVRRIDFEAIWRALQAAWEIVRPMVEGIVSAFRDNWEAIKQATSVVLGVLAGIFVAKWTIIVSAVRAFVANFSTIWEGLKGILGGFVDFFVGVFTLDSKKMIEGLGKLWNGLKALFSGLWAFVKDTFSLAFDALDKIIQRFTPEPVRKGWAALKTFFGGLWDWIEQRFDAAVSKVLGWVEDLKALVSDVVDAGRTVTDALGITEKRVALDFSSMVPAMPSVSAVPAPSVAAGAPSAAGGGRDTRSEVVVSFRDAPSTLQVSQPKTSGPGVVKTNVGRRQAGAGAP